ncbi:MAG: glycosyltransferase, partial [Candidatus Levyibacteriota bacterium]
VLGFGGYVSFPVCVAAFFLKIPVVIHEQTLGAGLANKEISRWAKKVCISWRTSEEFFPKRKIALTGNPLRKEILESKVESLSAGNAGRKSKVPIVYITGGSAGSHFMNELIGESLPELLKNYIVIHQTGDSQAYNDFRKLSEIKKALPSDLSKRYDLRKFITNREIGQVLANATVVVGRAGMNTITEIIYLKKPSILVPLKIAADNEQLKNATFAKEVGLSEIFEQDKLSSSKFIAVLKDMIKNIDKYKPVEGLGILIDKSAPLHIISIVTDVAKQKK